MNSGGGFLEKVYENAMAIELEGQGLSFRKQVRLAVLYRGQEVGQYFADMLIEERVICEFKVEERWSRVHACQLVNYLMATGIETGLLINFGRVTVQPTLAPRVAPRCW